MSEKRVPRPSVTKPPSTSKVPELLAEFWLKLEPYTCRRVKSPVTNIALPLMA